MNRMLLVALLSCLVTALPTAASAKPPVPEDVMAAPLADFAFQGTIRQAIEAIGDKAKVHIEVDWNALASSGAKIDAQVKVAAPKATPGQLLDSALSQAAAAGAPLAWFVADRTVRVTTQRRVLDRAGGSFVPVRPGANEDVRGGATAGGAKSYTPSRAIMRTAGLPDLDLDNVALGDVLEMFRKAAGVNLHVNWPALAVQNIDKSTQVSLHLKGVGVDQAMDLVFEQLNATKDKMGSVYWVVEDGIVIVATGTALDQTMKTQVKEVADLLMVVPNFTGPTMDMSALGTNNGTNKTTSGSGSTSGNVFNNGNTGSSGTPSALDADATNMAEARKAAADSLIAAYKAQIGADMWEPQGKGSVRLLGKQMIITQSLLGFELMRKAVKR